MDREIEFRGRRKDNGELVYGYYCKVEGKHYIIDKNAYIRTASTVGWGIEAICGFVEVIPETVLLEKK